MVVLLLLLLLLLICVKMMGVDGREASDKTTGRC